MNRNTIAVALMGLTAVVLSSGTALAGVQPDAFPIPEPSSMALAAAGIAGVAWARFRRRK